MTTFHAPDVAAPTPLGPTFRHARGADDADALLAVQVGRAERDQVDPLSSGESIPTRERLAIVLAEAEAAGQLDRYLIVELNRAVIGYGRVSDWKEDDGMHVWLHRGWVLPAWRGCGVGTALLRRLEGRIRELAVADGGERWEYAANASSTEPDATALLLDNGYRPGYTVLEMGLDWDAFPRPADGPALPAGFVTRPVRPEDAPAVSRSIDEAYLYEYADGRYQTRMNVDAFAEELLGSRYDLSLLQVAWAGDEVAGQVIPLIERGRAEIYEVSVRPAYRRRGLARALLSRALLDLEARGVGVVRLGTVAEFPTRAVELYQSLGFRILKEFPRYRKSQT